MHMQDDFPCYCEPGVPQPISGTNPLRFDPLPRHPRLIRGH
jgi:hypothetical protein